MFSSNEMDSSSDALAPARATDAARLNSSPTARLRKRVLVSPTMPPKTPKTIIDKVFVAIEALQSPGGSSRQAIAKYLKEHFEQDNAAALKRALDKAVAEGKLTQSGQSFSIPGLEFDAPEDERVKIEVLQEGFEESGRCQLGDNCYVDYVGSLADTGEVFESSNGPFQFSIGYGEVIKGLEQGVSGMKVNERRRLTIPPKLAYGKRGSPPEVPGDATLVFDVTMLRFEPL